MKKLFLTIVSTFFVILCFCQSTKTEAINFFNDNYIKADENTLKIFSEKESAFCPMPMFQKLEEELSSYGLEFIGLVKNLVEKKDLPSYEALESELPIMITKLEKYNEEFTLACSLCSDEKNSSEHHNSYVSKARLQSQSSNDPDKIFIFYYDSKGENILYFITDVDLKKYVIGDVLESLASAVYQADIHMKDFLKRQRALSKNP